MKVANRSVLLRLSSCSRQLYCCLFHRNNPDVGLRLPVVGSDPERVEPVKSSGGFSLSCFLHLCSFSLVNNVILSHLSQGEPVVEHVVPVRFIRT